MTQTEEHDPALARIQPAYQPTGFPVVRDQRPPRAAGMTGHVPIPRVFRPMAKKAREAGWSISALGNWKVASRPVASAPWPSLPGRLRSPRSYEAAARDPPD